VELSPTSYRCAEHGTDLTERVSEQLEERVPVAFGPSKARPFVVIVECPGGEHRHRLQFEGQILGAQRP
jgi:hypothetical protein